MSTKDELLAKAKQHTEDAMRLQAQQHGVARLSKSAEQRLSDATAMIQLAHEMARVLQSEGIIRPAPGFVKIGPPLSHTNGTTLIQAPPQISFRDRHCPTCGRQHVIQLTYEYGLDGKPK